MLALLEAHVAFALEDALPVGVGDGASRGARLENGQNGVGLVGDDPDVRPRRRRNQEHQGKYPHRDDSTTHAPRG
ncbi:MAG TPA: hypothetical protein VI670_23145 [Thermoanaerobaculia bacterium]